MERYICIHAHFYQPPRENPWLEAIELQDSAHPYHDWNERITAESYAPNAVARILNPAGRIVRLVNNYARISFNIGPTLLAWLEKHAPETYAAILDADRESIARFDGHGSAMAQVYNHIIMPLANRRDRVTQVRWGIADFEQRFGRRPEGMWLAETAVDLETLDLLAVHGMRYTVLAPSQAARVRPLRGGNWRDVAGARIDPTMPYLLRLPSGRSIVLFFYDGPISRAVAFERLLADGERFVNRLTQGFDDSRGHAQLMHIAVDGETYGHHHRHGDMALAYALEAIDRRSDVQLVNYGAYLAKHPPTHQVEIIERTAWSCSHGVGRWHRDCGCNNGAGHGWRQHWRQPLRDALDWLRDDLAPRFEQAAAALLRDPWAARDDYIVVINDRSPGQLAAFFARHARTSLSDADRTTALRLLEIQRQLLLMYTSCGWFFDDLSGIETVQVIAYAGRAIQLATMLFPGFDEQAFLARLERARSNIPDHGDGRRIFEKWIRPMMIDLPDVALHYAVSSLFTYYADRAEIYCYHVDREDLHRVEAGQAQVVAGQVTILDTITLHARRLAYGVLDFGDQNVSAGVAELDAAAVAQLFNTLDQLGDGGDVASLVRTLDRAFTTLRPSTQALFRDQRRVFLDVIMRASLEEDDALYRQIYERRAALMRMVTSTGAPLPRPLHTAAEFIINTDLRHLFEQNVPDPLQVQRLLDEARLWHISLDVPVLAFTLRRTMHALAQQLRAHPDSLEAMSQLTDLATLIRMLPFEVDIWRVQNVYHQMVQGVLAEQRERADDGDEAAQAWVARFTTLGETLGFGVNDMPSLSSAPTVASLVSETLAHPRVPRATYRLQFGPTFTFADAQALVPYLARLGISDVYASPIFAARAGSTHGYDVVDPGRINPDLGGESGFAALAATLRAHGMGLILDVVPNHMGIGDTANQWWNDVLENGPGSPYAAYFDIDWHPVKPELANKVLLPILEDQYGTVLEAGKLRLAYEAGSFALYYYATRLPCAPKTYDLILRRALTALTGMLEADDPALQEFRSILTAIGYLPPRTERDPEKLAERTREKEVIKRRLAVLSTAHPAVRTAIDETVELFNGRPGEPESFDLLDELLNDQAYRPAYWRVAAEEINYRRFFDINELAAIRNEDPAVFQATHQLIFHLLAEGMVSGLRLDHIDGLYDPTSYLRRLQEGYVFHVVQARLQRERSAPPDRAMLARRVQAQLAQPFAALADPERSGPAHWPLYVLAEKILGEGEALPTEWAIYGTTGYDFLNSVNTLLADPTAEPAFDRIYHEFAGSMPPFGTLVNSSKKMIMLVSMASEIYTLSHQLERISEKYRRYRDFTLDTLTFALREVIAALPVYRTYITGAEAISARDQAVIEGAVDEARRRNPRTAPAVFDFICDMLLLRNLPNFRPEDREIVLRWVGKFQQLTGPVMARGVEDTAFYVYTRLVAFNEVGGHPEHFGHGVAQLHRRNAETAARWPHALLATATHDHKRGEDVRARLMVLSELADDWRTALTSWRLLNAQHKLPADRQRAPSSNDEYLFYQVLLGAWPFAPDGAQLLVAPGAEVWERYVERLTTYMHKATREAKVYTSWISPNAAYDTAVHEFVRCALDPRESPAFLAEAGALAERLARFGIINSLAQTTLKLTSPGVPDIYQGCESWDLSLVDPDNRQPVDFEQRAHALAALQERATAAEQSPGDLAALCAELLTRLHDGRAKLYVIQRALAHRQAHPTLFAEGNYHELAAHGSHAAHVVAFARERDTRRLITVVPRLPASLFGDSAANLPGAQVWGDTWVKLDDDIPGQRYRGLLSGQTLTVAAHNGGAGLPLADILAHFPVEMLVRA